MSGFAMVRGRRLRATKLDGCGSVALGPSSKVVSKGFISVGLTANNKEGEVISVTNANGDECVHDEATPQFQNWTIQISFCGVDPELFTLLTGQPLVLSADGTEAVGFRVNSKVDADLSGFALELWTGIPVDACDDVSETPYGYLLIPFVKGGTIGDLTVENGAINFNVANAKSRDGSGWGVGPYDVTRDEVGAVGPLNEAITSGDHLHTEKVTVAPPTETDGAGAVGVPATLITAGTPATLSPANSYPPASLATIGAVTKSPTTAWVSGTYVTLRDGTTAHWSGTAWVAGPA